MVIYYVINVSSNMNVPQQGNSLISICKFGGSPKSSPVTKEVSIPVH